MFLQRGSRALRSQLQQVNQSLSQRAGLGRYPRRGFHASRNLLVVKPVLLADIGEGIVECEIIQWFVEPNARVEEFSPLCEVQSDKASVEITSRFTGVVKKLYYDAGEMAKVGKPFVDIDIQGDVKSEDLAALIPEVSTVQAATTIEPETASTTPQRDSPQESTATPPAQQPSEPVKGKHATLSTPAVRHLSKELDVDISHIAGTGKDGRVLKEDIYKYVNGGRKSQDPSSSTTTPSSAQHPAVAAHAAAPTSAPGEAESGVQQETHMQLSQTQQMMFKSMTRSLSIPHFLYADEIDFTSLCTLRTRLNKYLARTPTKDSELTKLSYLPFIIKAVSLALNQFPVLNARVDAGSAAGGNGAPPSKPSLVLRSQHNVGVAMDTPSGLLVPVVKNVGARSIHSIAGELLRLQKLAQAGKLTPQDMSGGTITVSNIGNIGGTYLSPVIVEREVAILGVGRMREVPAFEDSGVAGSSNRIVRKQVCNFSWSADHRVVDGATLARAAEVVRQLVEEPDVMVMQLR